MGSRCLHYRHGVTGLNSLKRYVLWPLRNLWRSLTSMRTALALLFLLAVAAIPGALLPQRPLNAQKTDSYISAHGWLGKAMDRLQLFDVFASAWFTAIYVLLFVSLVGCLTPRLVEHYRALRAKPVAAPRNLARLPRHVTMEIEGTPEEIAQRINGNLRGWRRRVTVVEGGAPGVVEVSAEKGYLREFGNLVFHFALLALLVSIAVGKLYGYEGTRTLVADGEQTLCNTSTAVYDSFRGGSTIDGTDLVPFCVTVDDFQATYLPNNQPDMYTAKMRYTKSMGQDPQAWSHATVRVNDPLRIAGDRVYVLGNGYAPTFTVTFPNGDKRTQTVPFVPEPDGMSTMLSSGAVRFDTPGGLYPDQKERNRNQIALEGIFAPSATFEGTLLTSDGPTAKRPFVAIRIYKGTTGLDSGAPQSVYQLDPIALHNGQLVRQAQANLALGKSTSLPDGTKVSFDGYKRWVSVQVSHDPAQTWVLVSAIAMLAGLLVSLLIRRRRIWARLVPVDQRRTVVEIAGLARTDQAGWGEGFEKQAAGLAGVHDE